MTKTMPAQHFLFHKNSFSMLHLAAFWIAGKNLFVACSEPPGHLQKEILQVVRLVSQAKDIYKIKI